MKNKKGISDILSFMLFIFFAAIIFLILLVLGTRIDGVIQQNPYLSDDAKAASAGWTDNLAGKIDTIFLLLFVLLWIAVFVTNLVVDFNPVVAVVTIIIFMVTIWIAGMLGNAYVQAATSGGISEFGSQLVVIPFIMGNYAIFVTVVGFSVLLAMYMKGQGGGGNVAV